MKTILSIITLFLIINNTYAQQEVTRFLGIPVDGSKTEMIQKLKAKGYTHHVYEGTDVLTGSFNGRDSQIFIQTNNNKVCRIMVCDANTTDETNIKIRFNNLCQQFNDNEKYISMDDYTISDDEDISYEMTVNKKRYEAIYYQKSTNMDSVAVAKAEEIQMALLSKYTEEQLANPTEEMQNEVMRMALSYLLEEQSKRPVWFVISHNYGEYYISMFYDNEYNRANGEDL